jgi:hypothetical protein
MPAFQIACLLVRRNTGVDINQANLFVEAFAEADFFHTSVLLWPEPAPATLPNKEQQSVQGTVNQRCS